MPFKTAKFSKNGIQHNGIWHYAFEHFAIQDSNSA